MENSTELQITPTFVDVQLQQEKALIDSQVATAHTYPRNLTRVISNIIATVQISKEIAEGCNYSRKFGTSLVSGPSVHLARIMAQQWCNLRVDKKIISDDGKQIIVEAYCYDLETNYANRTQEPRSVMQNEYVNNKRTGRMLRMNDQMVNTTIKAAIAIAERNAIFSVIPRAMVDQVAKAAKSVVIGNISEPHLLIKRRKEVIDRICGSYNVTEEEVLKAIDKASVEHIGGEEIAHLIGLGTAIKEGVMSVDDVFRPDKVKPDAPKTAADKERDRLVSFIEGAKTVQELNNLAEHITLDTKDVFMTKMNELTKTKNA